VAKITAGEYVKVKRQPAVTYRVAAATDVAAVIRNVDDATDEQVVSVGRLRRATNDEVETAMGIR
jgi:hypothetical protein